MNYFFKEEQEDRLQNAGPKSNSDIERALVEVGIKVREDCIIPNFRMNKWIYRWKKLMLMIKLLSLAKSEKGHNFLLLYPSQLSGRAKKFSRVFDEIRKYNKVYAFCMDIDSLRSETRPIEADICELNKFDGIVVYHKEMKNRLLKYGLTRPKIVELGILDYYTNITNVPLRKVTNTVAYAGNLAISEFLIPLRNLDLGFQLNLYGNGFDKYENEKSTCYKGSFGPEELVQKLEGAFGLIWGGRAFDHIEGFWGRYLEVNLPHKTSLYIVAGLPIIVWEGAAVARFIKDENIGFTIHDLTEIAEKISKISQNEYELYQQNCMRIARKVRTGYYTKTALKKLLS